MKALQCAVIVVVFTLPLVGCRSMTGRSLGQQVDDKVITSQVKSKLIVNRFANLFSTGVGTRFGVVSLTGSMPTEAQRAEAERIASGVAGVRGVKNELTVLPGDAKAARATDGAAPAASPAASPTASPAAGPMMISGQVTAINRDSGDVTVRTETGDMVLRLPPGVLRDLEQGQRLSINAGR